MPRGRFVNRPYEILINQGLLRCLFDSNCNSNSHTQPAGCYLRRIIDAERVCKLACKRAEEDCSTSVVCSTTRCKAPSIKRSAEAQLVRSISPSSLCNRHFWRASEWGGLSERSYYFLPYQDLLDKVNVIEKIGRSFSLRPLSFIEF